MLLMAFLFIVEFFPPSEIIVLGRFLKVKLLVSTVDTALTEFFSLIVDVEPLRNCREKIKPGPYFFVLVTKESSNVSGNLFTQR